jgi:LPS export ABC transporter protein LptC
MKQRKYDSVNITVHNINILIKSSIAALSLGAAMLLLSCQTKVEADLPSKLIEQEELPTVDATNFETTYTDSGIVRYRLTTPRLLQFDNKKDPYMEFPDGFHILEFDKNQKITSGISANYGKRYTREQKWEAIGNVVAVNSQGDTLKTEQLTWLEKDKRIYSDKYVRIIRNDQVITGIGLESDDNLKNWKILQPKGTLYVKEEQ